MSTNLLHLLPRPSSNCHHDLLPSTARCRWRQAPTTSNPCYGPPPPSSVLLPRHRNQGTNPPVPIMALETLIRASSPPLHPNMSNHHRCPWKTSIYRRRKIDWRSERSARVVETGVELRTREEVHHGGAQNVTVKSFFGVV
ncbi:hypothetical protein CFC21_083176 [Triticum aestivum]|uniref:Uncharacterized protein n=3 Tax=Triticum TaxID=4564 RepID=A0A9R1AYX5_TRITD|nr:hypothetical protein CFC21_083176 [Triticum aestivum]VAI45263.1 unnamed protein product [Triticum turgidum subsp. durum]